MTIVENEADVETQYILKLLIASEKLSIPLENIRSKKTIVPRDIGKGSRRRKGYIPDFTAYYLSLPVLVIEAKSPAIDVAIAFEEAQLYAHAINSSFPSQINPCSKVLACNGDDIWIGEWDSPPTIKTKLDDLVSGSAILDQVVNLIGDVPLAQFAAKASDQLRSRTFRRPFNEGAGPTWISSKIIPNTFAADLTPVLR